MRLTLPASYAGWTKTPNYLIDGLMPELRDTELRVLLVVVRGTTGWNRDGRFIGLPYRTLMLRTGRKSEAIAGAIASLRARGLIHVEGPEARRIPKRRVSERQATTNRNKEG